MFGTRIRPFFEALLGAVGGGFGGARGAFAPLSTLLQLIFPHAPCRPHPPSVSSQGNMLTFLWIPPKDDPLFVTAGPLSASQASPGATTASGEVVSLELGTAPPAASVAPDAASATAVAAATPAVPGEEAASTAATAVAAAAACTVSAPAAAAAGEAAAATAAAGPSRLNSSSTAAGGATAPASPAVMLLRPQGSAGYRAVSGSQGSGPALLAHAASRATSGSGDFLLQGSLATQPVEPQPTLPLAHRFVLGSATRTMGGASCTSAENTGGSAANVAIWESALAASRAAGGGGAQQPAPSQHQSGAHAQHPSVHWAGSANMWVRCGAVCCAVVCNLICCSVLVRCGAVQCGAHAFLVPACTARQAAEPLFSRPAPSP